MNGSEGGRGLGWRWVRVFFGFSRTFITDLQKFL